MNALSLPSIPDARLPRAYEAAQSGVYFVQNSLTGAVKIGFSSDIKRRVSVLGIGSDAKLHLIRAVSGRQKTERWLHKRFASARIKGEWFAFDPEMMTVCPPDEVLRPPVEVIRRDVGLTLREHVHACMKDGQGLSLSHRDILMLISGSVTEEQAAAALAILAVAS